MFWILLFALPSASAMGQAIPLLVLEEALRSQDVISLDGYGQYWVDSSGSATLDDAMQTGDYLTWEKEKALRTHWYLQNLKSPVWFRFSISNPSDQPLEYYLGLGLHEHTEAWVYRQGQQLSHDQLGNLLPLYSRPVSVLWPSTHNNSLLLQLLPRDTLTIYAKIRNPYGPNMEEKNSQFRTSLTRSDYVERNSTQHLLSAIFCQGALWFILIFHMVNFLINRSQVYLWYCLFLFAVILHLLDNDFILLYLFPDTYPLVSDYVFVLVVGLVFISYFQFSKVVMQSTQKVGWAVKTFKLLIRIQLGFFLCWLLFYSLNRFVFEEGALLWLVVSWHYIYQLLIVLEILTVIVLNVLLIRKADSNVTRYYVAANSYMASVLALHFLLPFFLSPGREIGADYLGQIEHYSLETSILGQVLLFSIALAYVIKEKEQKMERAFAQRLSEVEMQALRSQMNPHFLFNCLNSINRYVVSHQPAEASDYLARFARLIRLILQNSKSTLVLLSEEIEALRLYIEMESLRFEQKFTYEMIMSHEVDPDYIEIPPMLLQPYVENAIWHGLLHKEDGVGHLRMELKQEDNLLICIIEDNGIGREKASAMRKHAHPKKKSMGMKITSERLALLERQRGIKAQVEVADLVAADGSSLGTRVVVSISLNNMD
jgi:sensor histidine kinase YesM